MKNRAEKNWSRSREQLKWVELEEANFETYLKIGFKCGLEVHQQLLTEHKLFCRCLSGEYGDNDDYDDEIVRYIDLQPNELPNIDKAPPKETQAKVKTIYRTNRKSACKYELGDDLPGLLNQEALANGIEVALLLDMKIVAELQINRKQYLDGSMPAGFQRTAILGTNGKFPISSRQIRIAELSIEEDSCREVTDKNGLTYFYTDRMGMPLIETTTYPDMLSPQEAAEACQYIRNTARSTGKVRSGLGTGRQDVNVSITGGTRVEVKGVSRIPLIPKLTHIEAFRQRALIVIKEELLTKISSLDSWQLSYVRLPIDDWKDALSIKDEDLERGVLVAVNLPCFKNILSFFTQPARMFADEIADRVKAVPNIEMRYWAHSEELTPTLEEEVWEEIAKQLNAEFDDAQILFWVEREHLGVVIDTVEKRCQQAFEGVPAETRKAMEDGTTQFERKIATEDRIIADIDSKSISITPDIIDKTLQNIPKKLYLRIEQLLEWEVPKETHDYLLKNDLVPEIEFLSQKHGIQPKEIALLYAHNLKRLREKDSSLFDSKKLSNLIEFVRINNLTFDIVYEALPVLYENPEMQFATLLEKIGFKQMDRTEIAKEISVLHKEYQGFKKKSLDQPNAEINWIMGRVRKIALGNIPLNELRQLIQQEIISEDKLS